jgi:hypothetical protein
VFLPDSVTNAYIITVGSNLFNDSGDALLRTIAPAARVDRIFMMNSREL